MPCSMNTARPSRARMRHFQSVECWPALFVSPALTRSPQYPQTLTNPPNPIVNDLLAHKLPHISLVCSHVLNVVGTKATCFCLSPWPIDPHLFLELSWQPESAMAPQKSPHLPLIAWIWSILFSVWPCPLTSDRLTSLLASGLLL